MLSAIQKSIQSWLDGVPLRRRIWELLCGQPVPTYLVGGSVRDALLQVPSYDMDLAVDGDALALGRRLADAIRSAFVPLDTQRNVARIVVKLGAAEWHVDLAGLRAQGIVADLRARDLTVNAMAVAVGEPPGPLIDPTGGLADLQARRLRVTSQSAFAQDPIRILRAIRFRGALGFDLTPETAAQARGEAALLKDTSAERLRDELLNILSQPLSAEILTYADRLGVLEVALPELTRGQSSQTHSFQPLELIEQDLGPWITGEESQGSHAGRLAAALERFRPTLVRHWREPLAFGRPRWLVLKLAAALGAACSPEIAQTLAQRLHMSTREARSLAATILAARRAQSLSQDDALSSLAIYRYFREVRADGIGGATLALAEEMADAVGATAEPAAGRFSRYTAALVQAWFERHEELVEPSALLSGRDVMRALHQPAGPEIGHALEAVREAQVQGLVTDRAEALEVARSAVGRPGSRA
ncbi:MAG: CCA tRNA nucleotidyltransferase [Anaerolineae bacterium]|nr:CCA tRNA nucleotidyltransferase [Anaerolineae bacterium]